MRVRTRRLSDPSVEHMPARLFDLGQQPRAGRRRRHRDRRGRTRRGTRGGPTGPPDTQKPGPGHAYSQVKPHRGSARALRPRWREVTGLRAQWSATLPPGYVGPRNARPISPRATRNAARTRSRSRRTASRPRLVSAAWTGARDPASGAEPLWRPKAAASTAPTASVWRAISCARDAAKSGTSSAGRSAGTPSTPRPSTSSPRSRNASTTPPISIAASPP